MRLKDKQKKKKRTGNFLYDFIKITGVLPALIWLRPKIIRINKETSKKVKGGVLIASNHITFYDPITLHCTFLSRRLYSLATKDLFAGKLKTWFFTKMHCLIVDKENVNVASFRKVCDCLKEEKAVVVFPEGKVNQENEEVQDFKGGIVLMAHISHKPVLPVYLVKAKRWYHRHTIVIGEPIDINALCGKIPTVEELNKASEYLKEQETELKKYYETREKK